MTQAEQIADEIIRMINASPRTPTRAQFIDAVELMLDATAEDEPPVVVPPGTQVSPNVGASITVLEAGGLNLNGWNIRSSRKLSLNEMALAIVVWLRNGIMTAPIQ